MRVFYAFLAILVLVLLSIGIWHLGKGYEADIRARAETVTDQNAKQLVKLRVGGQGSIILATEKTSHLKELKSGIASLAGALRPRVKIVDQEKYDSKDWPEFGAAAVFAAAKARCEGDFQTELGKEKISFASGQSVIDASSLALLDRLAALAGDCLGQPGAGLVIQGHTDSTGADDANLALSQARADAVKTYLVGKGMDGTRIRAIGFGETKPLGSDETAEGRAENRRIEFKIEG